MIFNNIFYIGNRSNGTIYKRISWIINNILDRMDKEPEVVKV